MPRQLQPLLGADLWHIATHLDQPAAALAAALGRPYFTVAKAKQRMVRDGGWCTRLVWLKCLHCGGPLASPTGGGRRRVHARCESGWANRLRREKRAGLRGPLAPSDRSTAGVAAWRQRNPDRNRHLRERERGQRLAAWHDLPPEAKQADLDQVHASDRRDYPLTREEAEHSGEPWAGHEDDYLLEHWTEPAREIALEIGRTLWAVRGRRLFWRRRYGLRGRVRPPRPERSE